MRAPRVQRPVSRQELPRVRRPRRLASSRHSVRTRRSRSPQRRQRSGGLHMRAVFVVSRFSACARVQFDTDVRIACRRGGSPEGLKLRVSGRQGIGRTPIEQSASARIWESVRVRDPPSQGRSRGSAVTFGTREAVRFPPRCSPLRGARIDVDTSCGCRAAVVRGAISRGAVATGDRRCRLTRVVWNVAAPCRSLCARCSPRHLVDPG